MSVSARDRVAVIKVGAATETEMKERKLRIEDALNATKAAVEEGIVAGGGVALINAVPAVKKYVDTLSGDEKTGAAIIVRALEEPVRQIAENAGFEGSVVVAEIKKSKQGIGFNAFKETYEDMIKAGIVDPAKVTRSALQNAASASAILLTKVVAPGRHSVSIPDSIHFLVRRNPGSEMSGVPASLIRAMFSPDRIRREIWSICSCSLNLWWEITGVGMS